jgi:beta-lactamase class A
LSLLNILHHVQFNLTELSHRLTESQKGSLPQRRKVVGINAEYRAQFLIAMKTNRFTALLLVTCLSAACSRTATPLRTSQTHNVSNPLQSSAENKQTAPADAALQKQIELIAAAAKGHVGVAALVLETGAYANLNPADHFPMQSVYKLPIGMAVVKQVDDGRLKLDQNVHVAKTDFISRAQHSPIRDQNPHGVDLSIHELLEWMLLESDGTASDVLMRLAGGPNAVAEYLRALQITDMIVLSSEKEMGQDGQIQYRNWTTPDAAVALLRSLFERRGLSEASQALLLNLMSNSKPGAKRLKGLLPAGTLVAHRTGTSGTVNDVTAATNDIGIISLPNRRHVAIAVFVSDSPSDEASRERIIAKIAKAVWDKFQ